MEDAGGVGHAVQLVSFPPETGMTPENELLIRELIRLIVDERDPRKLWILASDLERLLIVSGRPLVFTIPGLISRLRSCP